ncbi:MULTISPECIES: SDR family oxidoreductase [unclassified Novosphingobium]|uniref:SDR family NAD(P)-dependent oxidoreductase n=1 Tax=unclassified Novosphingobium TaxID=2644732 RepID=UPI000EF03A79|nr:MULTISPECIES: SDR family oxidoreductase [unclassified Novosphingobium]HCF24825.1 short-chain dehydrogenase [Novosphingobium sp.]HQV01964.1 SDR family oxidoreductase [Novosphingobium sp.]
MQTAVITGAAQGLGLVTARLFAEAGYRVVLTDVQPLDAVLASFAGAEVSGLSGDVSSEAFIAELAAHVAALGGADVLVNNAGISMIVPAEETTLEQWQRMMAINLDGPFLLCRELGKQMLAKGNGAIVNVASVAGLGGVIHRAAYNTSKHGLIGLTRTLAAEWGGRGVRVNAVCPGWIKTEMDAKDMGSGAYTDADIVNRVPMARFAKPEDIAAAILFLARDGLFVNGVALPVDGGWNGDSSWDALRLKSR